MIEIEKGVYVLKEEFLREAPETEAYVYPRILTEDEIAFSVLDYASMTPDFSECGVFWVKPADFLMMFRKIDDELFIERNYDYGLS